MEADKHSFTAVMMAALRAYHHSSPELRVFDDPLADALLSSDERETFERTSKKLLGILNPGMAASCPDKAQAVYRALRAGPGIGPLVRARYIEDALLTALADRVQQYVIIGAGLDTFAFRRLDLMERLRVIEIDHPASQAFKRERLRQAGLVPPANLHFAAADLERESIADALNRTPYQPDVPAFFAWPGVTMYLTQRAILETLKSIAEVSVCGSRLAFDYIEPAAYGDDGSPRLRFVIEHAQQVGEPMMPNLNPSILESDLESLGFQLMEDLGPAEIQARYLAHADGFQAVEFWHLAQAFRISATSTPKSR